jgi:hypothetical protein
MNSIQCYPLEFSHYIAGHGRGIKFNRDGLITQSSETSVPLISPDFMECTQSVELPMRMSSTRGLKTDDTGIPASYAGPFRPKYLWLEQVTFITEIYRQANVAKRVTISRPAVPHLVET